MYYIKKWEWINKKHIETKHAELTKLVIISSDTKNRVIF